MGCVDSDRLAKAWSGCLHCTRRRDDPVTDSDLASLAARKVCVFVHGFAGCRILLPVSNQIAAITTLEQVDLGLIDPAGKIEIGFEHLTGMKNLQKVYFCYEEPTPGSGRRLVQRSSTSAVARFLIPKVTKARTISASTLMPHSAGSKIRAIQLLPRRLHYLQRCLCASLGTIPIRSGACQEGPRRSPSFAALGGHIVRLPSWHFAKPGVVAEQPAPHMKDGA